MSIFSRLENFDSNNVLVEARFNKAVEEQEGTFLAEMTEKGYNKYPDVKGMVGSFFKETI